MFTVTASTGVVHTNAETESAATGPTFAICRCCSGCSDQALSATMVTCRTCGGPCSCPGCAAEES